MQLDQQHRLRQLRRIISSTSTGAIIWQRRELFAGRLVADRRVLSRVLR
jgi:hypothetical protein